jgi:hypothetical protein
MLEAYVTMKEWMIVIRHVPRREDAADVGLEILVDDDAIVDADAAAIEAYWRERAPALLY